MEKTSGHKWNYTIRQAWRNGGNNSFNGVTRQREVTTTTLRRHLGQLLDEVQNRQCSIVITKAGKPVAAMVDMATYERMVTEESGEFAAIDPALS